MSLTVCHIHFSQQSNHVVYVSNSLVELWKLDSSKPLFIKLGQDHITAQLKLLKRKGKHIYLSSSVRQRIKVPTSGAIHVLYHGNNEIQLGPLIGVLTDQFRENEASPFTSRSSFVKEIIRYGHNKAFTFGFIPADINWQDKTVLGPFLSNDGNWYRRKVTFPDVVYNRLPNRKKEVGEEMTKLREKFVEHGIPMFNWSFLNKNDVYELLNNDPEALKHIPESYANPNPNIIKEMLDKFRFIYFKPSSGSLGYGIYRITYHPTRGYFLRYRTNDKNHLLRFDSFKKMYRQLQLRLGRNISNYVAQQGIRLIEIDKCPIDFRFHMHKDGQNNWQAVGVGAKKAGRGSVTTHMRNGGTLMTPMEALKITFGNQAEQILGYAKQVSIMLSEAIERNYPHRIGELGLDIGIDQNGEVWMFEANAKPGRSIFKHPELKTEGKASLKYIVDHCMYLSRFQGDD